MARRRLHPKLLYLRCLLFRKAVLRYLRNNPRWIFAVAAFSICFLVYNAQSLVEMSFSRQDELATQRHREQESAPRISDAVLLLIHRVFEPGTVNRVRVKYTLAERPYFTLRLAKSSRQVLAVGEDWLLEIDADGVLSACAGLHHYCLHYAACTLTWGQSARPMLPRALPRLESKSSGVVEDQVTRKRVIKHAYYLNFCTPSYTMAWWSWERWERELDWMALHSVSMPLIVSGREVVMRRLFLEFGMPDVTILEYFTGPAYLAWHRMGNLQGFGGPMPLSYLEHLEELTVKILSRARQLGMTPVLPGFSGHIPRSFEVYFKLKHADMEKLSYSQLPLWSGFSNEYSGLLFLEPNSTLYITLGKRFIEIQTELFGTDHLYAVDQFNENDPKTRDIEYLAACGRTQFQSLKEGDENAIWVMQGWLFVFHGRFWGPEQIDAYIGGVPNDRMIILDLISEATPAYDSTHFFNGKPFVWSLLHNFGGQNGMRGNLATVMTRPYEAMDKNGSNMVGIGLTMEAINQNPIMYELALDHVWNEHPRDLGDWLRAWVRARYGYTPLVDRNLVDRSRHVHDSKSQELLVSDSLQRAWTYLQQSCYNVMDPAQGNGYWGVTKSVIEKRPTMVKSNLIVGGFQSTRLEYNACHMVAAWKLFAKAAEEMVLFKLHDGLYGTAFELDFLDVTRQVLSNHAQTLIARFVSRSRCDEYSAAFLGKIRDEFLTLLDDLDHLLRSRPHFSFDTWMAEANDILTSRATTSSSTERGVYSYNARNLLTLWGPVGEINDYSSRLWGGLIKHYYKKRWSIAMNKVVKHCEEKAEPGKENLYDGLFEWAVRKFELKWQNEPYVAPAAGSNLLGGSLILALLETNKAYSDRVSESCEEAV